MFTCCSFVFTPWHLNPSPNALPGGVLRDRQQKPELWEEILAMQPAPSGYSRRRVISCYVQCWESLHRRRGVKSQRVDRVDGGLERWGRRCKIIHVPSFATQLQNSNLSVFHPLSFSRPLHHVGNHGMSARLHFLHLWLHNILIQVCDFFQLGKDVN